MSFELVFVCTANRGRSPVAETIARSLTPADVSVASCGIRAVPGLPPLPEAIVAAKKLGFDISGHRSAPLERESLQDADLVVGFEPIHVATAVVEGGAQRDKAFTLPELVGRSGTVTDPIGRPQAVVDGIVSEIDTLTRRLVRDLFG
jgi:protein-tyrosine phosphatase